MGRAAGATSYFEDVMLRLKTEPGEKAIIFLDRRPTVLTNVLTERFLADGLENLIREMAVGAIKEINASCHNQPSFD
jgi:hypothetical protein